MSASLLWHIADLTLYLDTLAELLYDPKMPTFPDVAVVAGIQCISYPLLHVPVILSNLGIPPRSRDVTVTRQ